MGRISRACFELNSYGRVTRTEISYKDIVFMRHHGSVLCQMSMQGNRGDEQVKVESR
jgi:hypothetical protein